MSKKQNEVAIKAQRGLEKDDTKYITESTLFECENVFSWQLLFNIFPKAKFIFTSPSTLELYTTKDLDVERFY